MKHCENNKRDRELGQFWEEHFSKMAAQYGRNFIQTQIGRSGPAVAYGHNGRHHVLPDIQIWTSGFGEHHEIKHKSPTSHNTFGLETYRFESLLWLANETQQDVMYTIHNHALPGASGRRGRINNIAHWITVNVLDLDEAWRGQWWGDSWVDGIKKRVPIYYWSVTLWQPLREYWEGKPQQIELPL